MTSQLTTFDGPGAGRRNVPRRRREANFTTGLGHARDAVLRAALDRAGAAVAPRRGAKRAAATRAALRDVRNSMPPVSLVALPLFAADAAATLLTCAIAWLATSSVLPMGGFGLPSVALALFVPIALGNQLTGLYPGTALNPVVEFRQLSRVTAIALLGTAALTCFSELRAAWAVFFAVAWAVHFFLAPLSRAAMRRLCRGQTWWGYPTVVFGAGEGGRCVIESLVGRPEYGLRPVAVLDPRGASDLAASRRRSSACRSWAGFASARRSRGGWACATRSSRSRTSATPTRRACWSGTRWACGTS